MSRVIASRWARPAVALRACGAALALWVGGVGCASWGPAVPPSARSAYDLRGGEARVTRNPSSVKAFSPAWRADLGDRGPFVENHTFIGGVALHESRPLLAVVGYQGRLQIRHKESGELLWEEQCSSPGTGSPVFDGDSLLIPTGDGRLSAYHVTRREFEWRRQLSGLTRAPLTLDQDRLYVTDGTNTLYALSRRGGDVLWQRRREAPKDFSLHGEARPLAWGRSVFMGFSDGVLMAYEGSTGQPLWERDLAPQRDQFQDVDADPVMVGDTLVAASAASGLYGLDPATGAVRWFHPIAGVITLSEHEGDLIVGLQHGELGRFQVQDKAFVWRVRFGTDGAPSRVQAFPRGLAVSLSRGGLYVLDARSGELRDQFSPGSGVLAPMAMSPEGWLYASSLSGFLYAFSPR